MSVIRIGFTGTRNGMTPLQIWAVHDYLAGVQLANDNDPGITGLEAHHGDCLGSDAAFHAIATALRWRTVIHPPRDPSFRAWCKGDEIRAPKDYLARDWDIAQETGELLATPDGPPRRGSGTWATIAYAIQLHHPVKMFFPGGTIGFGYEYRDQLRAVTGARL